MLLNALLVLIVFVMHIETKQLTSHFDFIARNLETRMQKINN